MLAIVSNDTVRCHSYKRYPLAGRGGTGVVGMYIYKVLFLVTAYTGPLWLHVPSIGAKDMALYANTGD